MALDLITSMGGAFTKPDIDLINGNAAASVTLTGTETLTNKTLTAPGINGAVTGTAFYDRTVKTATTAIAGAALQAGVLNWANPEGVGIIVQRALLNVTTASTGAATVDVGVTAVSATTESDTLLDGVDVNAAVALFDSMNAALDSGANAKAQTLAAGKWVTVKSKSGDTTGMVATLYVQYILA